MTHMSKGDTPPEEPRDQCSADWRDHLIKALETHPATLSRQQRNQVERMVDAMIEHEVNPPPLQMLPVPMDPRFVHLVQYPVLKLTMQSRDGETIYVTWAPGMSWGWNSVEKVCTRLRWAAATADMVIIVKESPEEIAKLLGFLG